MRISDWSSDVCSSDLNYFDYDMLNTGPSAAHWFGVDPLGRDIFSRILMGARISLAAGFLSVLLGALAGCTLGLLAGYYEGWWDRITMRISAVLFAFPGILLALGVVAILGSSMRSEAQTSELQSLMRNS